MMGTPLRIKKTKKQKKKYDHPTPTIHQLFTNLKNHCCQPIFSNILVDNKSEKLSGLYPPKSSSWLTNWLTSKLVLHEISERYFTFSPAKPRL